VTLERSDQESRAATGQEFEDALYQAEVLLRQADGWRTSINRYRAVSALGWGVSVIVLILVLAVGSASVVVDLTVVTAIVVANAVLTSTLQTVLIKPLQAALARDERCAINTVGLLRELLPFIARAERWSLFHTERARFRIGRFPIEGGST